MAAPQRAAARAALPAWAEKQLTALARELKREKSGAAYSQLAAFARRHSRDELGARAALALGCYDYGQARYPEARRWLGRAKPEALLGDYVLFWSAQVDRNLGDNARALDELERLRRSYPQSAIGNVALQALAEAAITANQPQRALAALTAPGAGVNSSPTLLFLRAQAREQAGDNIAAAGDYLAVYDRFPLAPEAGEAGDKIKFLEGVLGASFPAPALAERLARAAMLYGAGRWEDAEADYAALLPELKGPDLERAQLHQAASRVALGANPSILAALALPTPDVDAERLYDLVEAFRSLSDESDMTAAVSQAIARAPASPWTEKALFAAGNYFWVNLDRDTAAKYYAQVVQDFPAAPEAMTSAWRMAWAAYLERKPEAASAMENFLRRFPDSPYLPDALYWLGRLAERANQAPLARADYQKLRQRFPHNYFTLSAAPRLRALGRGPVQPAAILAAIAPLPAAVKISRNVPPEAAEAEQRAEALETIAFDGSAEIELQKAYAATQAPALELEIAHAATAGEHYGGAIVALRTLYPELESRRLDDVPPEIWRLAYPLPYAAEIRGAARRAHLDPLLVAGLIRQESAFEKDARSRSDAFGLMQLLPETAREISWRLRLRYSEARLLNPAYNLRLGTVYLANLRSEFPSTEAALAAYNAGEDRVAAWQAGQAYAEAPEFVESIPFTETRQYVEIVMRNAELYRELYGGRR